MWYEFGNFRLDATRRLLVSEQGEPISLTAKAVDTLLYLVEHRDVIVEKTELMAAVWPNGVVEENNLNQLISVLRRALGESAGENRFIVTYSGRGYRFVADVKTVTPAEANELASTAHTAVAQSAQAPIEMAAEVAVPTSPTSQGTRPRNRFVIGAIGALLLTVIVVAVFAVSRPDATRNYTASVATPKPRLAVLPFENLSPDAANAFFTDGMHEEILSTLANRAKNLEVISRTTMMSYKGRPITVAEIVKALGVTHVLEGSVRREGQTVRLTLQLIDARTDHHVWSQNYDRQLANAMTLQSEVASEVALRLAIQLSARGDLPPSANPEAYDLYLKARLAQRSFGGETALQERVKVEDWMNQAIALDPSYAAAYVLRAQIRLQQFTASYDFSETNLRDARMDLRVAREHVGDAPLLLVVEAQYAWLVDWDVDKALRLIETATAIAPNSPEVAVWKARFFHSSDTPEAAFAIYKQGAELDPGDPRMLGGLMTTLWAAHRPEEAMQIRRVYKARYPDGDNGQLVFAFTGRTDALEIDVNRMVASIDPGSQLASRFNLLRFQHRLPELTKLIEQSPLTTIRQGGFSGTVLSSVGSKPVAELHGWANLLAGDNAAAARDGRIMLDFVAHGPMTKWNAWYLRLLAAEGALFTGNKAQAIADTRAVSTMVPRKIHFNPPRFASAMAARIFAWAGAEDEAVSLLEELSKGYPGIGPAEITRDPLYSMPLKNNARYKILEKKLEAEIVENQKLL